ncbi:MAG: site-specific DNA-methyltransferase [Lachnospiraceae bacterium]|nr:site-specific DNA-methyltransferase [Lachnospiraceae bacterium]
MANLSQIKREQMIAFLEKLKEQHSDDESLIAFNQIENELTSKKYGLVWEEHEENVDMMMQTKIPVFTEVPEKAVMGKADDSACNFLLEGDNLHSLKLLEKTHRGHIDIIYIDPPYNTRKSGEDESGSFIYDDKIVDGNDLFAHSKWLSFMHSRLSIAKRLLKRDGIIFISIGKEEVAQLRLLCDEIFGEDNLLGQVVRRTKTTSFRGNYFALRLDYILVYANDASKIKKFADRVDISDYKKVETEGKYAGEKYKDDTAFYLSTLETRPNQRYFIECPDGELVIPPGNTLPQDKTDGQKCVPDAKDGVWRWEVEQYKQKKYYLSFKKSKQSPLLNQDGDKASWNVYTKSYYCEKKDDGNIPTELFLDFINRNGTEELKGMGISFSFPKPSELIKYLIEITNKPKDITVLDFFAGSGTTGQAVLRLNQEDSGTRKFILCTNNENNICEEITLPRLKTVITGQKKDGTKYSSGIPSNLLYYRTDFVDKKNEEITNDLLGHISEMIQLQYGVRLDGQKYVMIMDDEEMDEFESNISAYSDLKAIFVNQDVLLSSSQERLLRELNTFTVPDCYFDFELREAGELW